MQHVMKSQNSHEQLLERILSRENMHLAWKRVKENKGAPGVDTMTIEQMPEFLREHWKDIRESLVEGSYQPSPVLRVEIPKPTGGTRCRCAVSSCDMNTNPVAQGQKRTTNLQAFNQ